jgi:hypothetical protein
MWLDGDWSILESIVSMVWGGGDLYNHLTIMRIYTFIMDKIFI